MATESSSDEEQEMEIEDGSEDASEASDDENSMDLEASATESDEEADGDEEEADSDTETKEAKPQTLAERVAETLQKKYEDRRGKQLFVRFPKKLPAEDEEFQRQVKNLSPLIVHAHKPRQKHARFCLVDFATKEDRDAAMKSIKKGAQAGGDLKDIVVSIPKTESADFVDALAEQKLKSMENKKAKKRLLRASKLAQRSKYFTSSIVVLNLPKNASLVEVRNLFPNAVDIQIKTNKDKINGRSFANVNLPSTAEARAAVRRKLSIAGQELKIRFNKPKSPIKKGKKTKPQSTKNAKPTPAQAAESKTETQPEGEIKPKKGGITKKGLKPEMGTKKTTKKAPIAAPKSALKKMKTVNKKKTLKQ